MTHNPFNMKLLLGSQSPRRRELLQTLGFSFKQISIDCDEVYPPDVNTEDIAQYLSLKKANAFRDLSENEVLLTADTVVAIGKEILGKPKNRTHAVEMLAKLSNTQHRVYTGITLRTFSKTVSETDYADVEFDKITEEEIDYYLDHNEALDKAGGYGIQDWIGMSKIISIKGSFCTIMGLPTHIVYKLLKAYQF